MPFYRYRRPTRRTKRAKATRATRQIVRQVVQNQAEEKYFAQNLYNGQLTGATWLMKSAIAGIVQGTTASTRLGNAIRLKRIDFAIYVEPNGTGMGITGSVCKLMLWHNKQASGAVLSPTTLYNADNINALLNWSQHNRCTELKVQYCNMWTQTISGSASTSANGTMRFNWSIFPKTRIDFVANNGNNADILSDDYGFGFVSDVLSCCKVTCNVQVIFTDA